MPPKINDTVATHIIAVYRSMLEDSNEIEGQHIYVGRLSELTASLAISSTYYSRIFRALYDGGYAALEDRGGRGKPSTVVLIREPEKDELLGLTSTDSGPIISTMKRLEAIERSLGGVYVVGALKEVERRLTALEEKSKGR